MYSQNPNIQNIQLHMENKHSIQRQKIYKDITQHQSNGARSSVQGMMDNN